MKQAFSDYDGYNATDLKSGFNQTSMSGNQGPASLKGKLISLEDLIKSVQDEMNFHKKILRNEKDTLEQVLTLKIQDIRKQLSNEIFRVEEEIKRHFSHQKAENSRLQQQITALKVEKTSLQQQLLGLNRRVSEIELQVGNEDV